MSERSSITWDSLWTLFKYLPVQNSLNVSPDLVDSLTCFFVSFSVDSYNFSLSDSDVGNSLKTLQFDLYLLPQRPQKTATSPPTKIAEVERAWVKTSSLNTSITVSQNLILHTPIFCAGVFAFFSEGRSNPINIWSVLNGAVHVLNWCHFVDMHLLKKNCVLSTKAKENCQKYNKLEFLLSPSEFPFSLSQPLRSQFNQ